MAWIKATPTKPAPESIRDQSLFLRDTLDDVQDFPTVEVERISDWVIRKVSAGDIRPTFTPEQRANGGRVKALRVRQRNFQRDTQIVAEHREGKSNRAIAASVNISEAMVRKVLKRGV